MELSAYNLVGITSAEAGFLTSGIWNGIKKGYEVKGYCHECDNESTVAEVVDYYLNLDTRCITAGVVYKCCGSESIISFAILDKILIEEVLTMSRAQYYLLMLIEN